MTDVNQSQIGMDICVVIPTFCRSKGLRAAVESLFLQNIMVQDIRVLVVDNNPEPIEKPLIDELSLQFNHNIEYVHEPTAGVSNARNAAMKVACSSRYIAFLLSGLQSCGERPSLGVLGHSSSGLNGASLSRWTDLLNRLCFKVSELGARIVISKVSKHAKDQNSPSNCHGRINKAKPCLAF